MEDKQGWIGDPVVKDIRTTKKESETRLEKMQNYLPELTGYGITGAKEDKIAVICEKTTPEIKSMFRKGIRGKDVEFLEVGEIIPAIDRKSEVRPVLGGISVSHYLVTGGTLGAIVYDKTTNEPLILSNNHVIANGDQGDNSAFVGDQIVQPGPIDGGSGKVVGNLKRWGNLTHGCTIDAAVASLSVDFFDYILDIPKILGTTYPKVGMEVKKSGRTTGYTEGSILAIESTMSAIYNFGKIQFKDQVVTSCMHRGGDSGSVGITKNGEVFGLLFAGSDSVTTFNDINNVTEQLNIEFKPYGVSIPTVRNNVKLLIGIIILFYLFITR